MSRELLICPGVGGRKCGAILSTLDRDPHLTCARCRGKICTRDMTCDICADWSFGAVGNFFVKKRSYKERKKTRPSGSVPPVLMTSPRAETPSGVFAAWGLPPLLFPRPSGGQDKRGGVSGCTWCGVPGGFLPSPPAGSRSSERGEGSVFGHSSCARARSLLFSSFGSWGLLGRSGLPLPAPLPRLLLPVSHRTFHDVWN